MKLDLERAREHISAGSRPFFRGSVDNLSGVIVEARGVPAAMGELCRIERGALGPVEAEVVGFRGTTTLLMPHGELDGIAPNQRVIALGRPFTIPVGDNLLGRALDGFGLPIDDGGPVHAVERRRVRNDAPAPLSRKPIDRSLQTGVRVVDGLVTLGRGQRMGIFSGSGVGKSSLLGQIARGTEAEVLVVALVGERGREVRGFLEEVLADTRDKAVTVVATSDRPPIERFLAPFVAVSVAEYFRDQGKDVLLVMDSVTRFAAASREIGLAAGEPPTVRGYPPSFFATVPKLIERMGCSDRGSITGLISVLLDGDDPHEPVADTLRGLLDGHLLLSRELAQRGHFPAVDVLGSLSRLMDRVVSEDHKRAARFLREKLAVWQEGRDLVEIGAYRAGSNPALDLALELRPAIEVFLQQGEGESTPFANTVECLTRLEAAGPAGSRSS